MDKLEQLHQLLKSKGLDNKTFEEFKDNFGDNPEKQRQLHSFLVSKQMDNKSFEEFQSNFFIPLKKKEDSTLETETTDGLPTPTSLDSSEKTDEEEAFKTFLRVNYPELNTEYTSLQEELGTLPMISNRSGQVQKRIDEIKSYVNRSVEDASQLGPNIYAQDYINNRLKVNEIKSNLFEIEKKYDEVSKRTDLSFEELISNDGTYQDLKNQQGLYESFNEDYDKALEDISKDTGGKTGAKDFMHTITGLFNIDTENATEITKMEEELRLEVLKNLGSEKEMQKAAGGYMTLEEKEEIIAMSKMSLFSKKYQDAQKVLDDPDATTEEKVQARNELSNSFLDLGISIVDGKMNVNPAFKKTIESKKFKEMASENPILDTFSTFVGGVTKLALQRFVQFPAEIMAAGMNFFFYEDDQYSPADAFIDSFSRFTNFNYVPSSEEKGLLVNENGEFEFSGYGVAKGVAEALPFTLGLLAGMKSGKFKLPKNNMITKMFSRYKNPQKAYERYKLVTESYKLALSGSMEEARDLGLDKGDAVLYGNSVALMEGVTGLIMPDTKYFKTVAGKGVLKSFKDNLKKAASKKARYKVIQEFFTNIGKEIGEEEAMLAYQDIAKTIALTDHELFSDITDIAQQKQLLTVTVGLSGSLGSVKIPSSIKENRNKIYKEIKENADVLSAMISDEIDTFPEKKEDLTKVNNYIANVKKAVETSPENVTPEQIELLTQKIELQKEMESVDDSFKGPIQDKIDNINKQIADAFQEQETRDIPDAKPAEGVQEMEEEVRVTPEEETEVESPIQDNLQENETIVQTREDNKGRVFTTTKQESERDGIKITKFKFNRSDKATDQRNDAFVSEEVALEGTNLEINPEDRLEAKEGDTITYEISEIREGETGAGASVRFTTFDADGNNVGSFQGDVTLVEKTGAKPKAESEVEIKTEPATIDGAPDGTYLNVGMIEGKDGRELTEEEIESALPDGVEVLEKTRLEKGENVDEPTLSIKTSRALTDAEMKAFREATGQLAIPQIVDGEGTMFGTTDWGPFNPEFFIMPDKAKLSDVAKPVAEGVSKLRGAFGRKAAGAMRVNTLQQKLAIEQQAEKARKAIAKRYPDMKIEVFYNESDYHKAIGEADQSKGTYFNNKVYINLTRATETTVAHEVFHGILSNELKNDAQVQALMKRFVDSLSRSQDPALVAIFAGEVAKVEQYKDVQNEEIMAELFGTLAGEDLRLRPESKSLIKRFLDKLAKMFGLKQFTDSEVVDVLNTLAGKIATGQEVTTEDASLFNGGKIVDNPIQAITNKSVGGFDVQYTEASRRQELIDKGLLVEANDVSGFAGNQVTITSPDDMLAGTISIDGKQIFEGGGGVFFVTKYGDVWASGDKVTANTLARMVNDSLKVNGDRGFLVLTKGTDQKLISSVSGVDSSLAILDVMLDKGLISPSDFRSAVSGAVKKAGGIIKLGGSAKQLKLDVNKYFSDPRTTTFEKRGNVVKDIIGKLAQLQSVKQNSKQIIDLLGGDTNKKLGVGNTELSQSLGDLVANVAAEQLTKGLSVGDVYGIIEVNGEVEVVEDSHPSYPFHVRLKDGSKPKLILPKNRQNGSEVLKTSTGKTYRVGNVSVLSGSFNSDIKPKKQVSGRPSMEEVYSKANEMGVSQKDARSFLKELGYTNNQIKDFVFKREDMSVKRDVAGEKNIFVKGKNITLNFLDNIKRKLTSAKSYMPKNAFIAKEIKNAHIQAEVKVAERIARRLNKMLKDQPDSVYNEVNKLMRGEKANLPIKISLVATAMRNHIDSLSEKLVMSGAVESEAAAANIMSNIGEYMNRSYRLFDDKNYAKNISEEVILEAKEFLKAQELNRITKEAAKENITPQEYVNKQEGGEDFTVEQYVDAIADQSVRRIIKKNEANAFVSAVVNEAKKDTNILKERKEIPAEIRALMGEYTDAAYNYVMSVGKIKAIIETQKYLDKLKDIGDGVFLFKEGDPRMPTEGYDKIASKTNKALEPLNGYYAPEELVKQMNSGPLNVRGLGEDFQKAFEVYMKAVGAVKYAKTILSVGTHAKNVLGNAYFMAQNGYFNPKDYNEAFKVLKNEFSNLDNEQLNKKLDEYIKAGIINQGVSLREIQGLLEGEQDFDVKIEKRTAKRSENIIKKGAKNLGKKLEEAYQAEDDLFKIVAYENEKRDYAKIEFDKDYNDLSEEEKAKVDSKVAEIVKNILPNYSRLGNISKKLRVLPVATFISFQLEAYRTAFNTLDLALKEVKSENPREQKKGAKRLTTLIGFQALKYAVLGALGNVVLGDDDDDDEEGVVQEAIEGALGISKPKTGVMDVRPFLPFWSQNSDILITKAGDGKFSYIDMSASDPYGGLAKVFRAAQRGDNVKDAVLDTTKELLNPIFSPDILAGAINTIIQNRDVYGKKVFEETDSADESAIKIIDVLYKTFEPGTLTSLRKIAGMDTPGKAYTDYGRYVNKMMKKENRVAEAIGQLFGFKNNEVDVEMQLNYKLGDLKEQMKPIEIKQYIAKKNIETTGDATEYVKLIESEHADKNEIYQEASKLVKSAMKLGLTIEKVYPMLKSKFPKGDDATIIFLYDQIASQLMPKDD